MLRIIQVPHKILNTPTQPVAKIDQKIKNLVYEMEETLIKQVDPQGVGLAAPQVGINLSLFIIKTSPKAQTEVCINPKILKIENLKRHSGPVSEHGVNSSRNPEKHGSRLGGRDDKKEGL